MKNKNNKYKSLVLYILIPLVLIFAVFFASQTTKSQTKSKDYSEILSMVKNYEISEFELNLSSGKLNYKLRAEGEKGKIYTYTVADSSIFYNDVNDFVIQANEAGEAGKTFVYNFKRGGEGAIFINLLPSIGMIALFAFAWFFIMRRMNQSMGNDKMMGFGKAKIKNNLHEIVDVFVRNGYTVTVHPTQEAGDAMKAVKNRPEYYFDLVVCGGGDGTLDEVVTGMMQCEQKIPIGYIPTGTTNDFASSLHISKDMLSAAHTAVHGTPFACDIGTFNKDIFDVYGNVLDKYSKMNLLNINNGNIKLTAAGFDVSNTIFCDFLLD